MDIAKISMGVAQTSQATSVSLSMLKKSMDLIEQNGKQIVEMIEGSTIDIKI